jgi:hypothetical protein
MAEEKTEVKKEQPKVDKIEQLAIQCGFISDNYYTAKDKMLSRCERSEESSFAYPFEFTKMR